MQLQFLGPTRQKEKTNSEDCPLVSECVGAHLPALAVPGNRLASNSQGSTCDCLPSAGSKCVRSKRRRQIAEGGDSGWFPSDSQVGSQGTCLPTQVQEGKQGFSQKNLEGYGLREHTCTLDQLRLGQNCSFLVIRYLHFYYLLFLTMCVVV